MKKAFDELDTELYTTILNRLNNELLPKTLPILSASTIVFNSFIEKLCPFPSGEIHISIIYIAFTEIFLSEDKIVKSACSKLIQSYLTDREITASAIIKNSIVLGEFLDNNTKISDAHLRTKITSLLLYFLSIQTRELVQ